MMPPTAPVPSKGALRALRHLALGACSIAVCISALAEEQRRRIQTVRRVIDNGNKIRSVKNYHATPGANIEALATRNMDDNGWTSHQASSSVTSLFETSGSATHNDPHQTPRALVVDTRWDQSSVSRDLNPHNSPGLDPVKQQYPLLKIYCSNKNTTPIKIMRYHAGEPSDQAQRSIRTDLIRLVPLEPMYIGSSRLASDIERLLEDLDHPGAVDAATLRLVEAFEEGYVHDISKDLIQAAAKLSRACRKQSKHHTMEKILETILSRGPVSYDEFLLFEPEIIIEALLSVRIFAGSSKMEQCDEKLKRAAFLFMLQFSDHPIPQQHMLALGQELCHRTCESNMYKLTQDIYWRLHALGATSPDNAADLVIATCGLQQHSKAVQYFKQYFKTAPTPFKFDEIVRLVSKSVSRIQKPGLIEDVLNISMASARPGGFLLPSQCMLVSIHYHWRTTKDISKTQELFQSLEDRVQILANPSSVYIAMIQFFVEANKEDGIAQYLAKLDELRGPYALGWPARLDARLLGHFALAKSKRGDWDGVHEDFAVLHSPGSWTIRGLQAVFPSILGIYAESHSVTETEVFLRTFVEQYKIPVSKSLSNIMVHLYGAAKEIDSICRWVEYVQSCTPSSISEETFNIILINCRRTWHFNYDEVFRLYLAFKNVGAQNVGLINDRTIDILRRVAINDCHGDQRRLAQYLAHDVFSRSGVAVSHSSAVLLNMTEAVARGNSSGALRICYRAGKRGISMTPEIILTALKASLQVHGDHIEPTAQLLDLAGNNAKVRREGLAKILIYQLDQDEKDPETRDVPTNRIFQTMRKIERSGTILPRAVVTHTAQLLARRGYYRSALQLWLQQGPSGATIDLPTLKMCLRSYIGLRDIAGIKWVTGMLQAYDVPIDGPVRMLLKSALQATNSQGGSETFRQALTEALAFIDQRRDDAAAAKQDVKIKTLNLMRKAVWLHEAQISPPLPTAAIA